MAACDVTLVAGLRPDEADRVSALLNQRGVATLRASDNDEPGLYRIDVGAESVPSAVSALAADRCRPSETALSAARDDTPLLLTQRDQRQQANQLAAQALTRAIEQLPGVTSARVQVELPVADTSLAHFTLPTRDAPARATVVVTRVATAASVEKPVQRLALSSVPGLAPQMLTIIESAAAATKPACPALARVGPINVVRDSARALKGWLGAALLGNMLLASALLYVLTRRRRAG